MLTNVECICCHEIESSLLVIDKFASIKGNIYGHTITTSLKVSGPFVETSCVFQCIKNIINAEMWA